MILRIKTMKFPPIGASMTGYGLPEPMPTPAIEQLYNPTQAKYLPGSGPKSKGKFVDWGTKLYELELELSYKNNEIDVLQKKLKKLGDELYPEGDTKKRSIISTLRTRNEAAQKTIQTKQRQLTREKKRCRGLESDLAGVKKENKELRKRNLVNEKSVQTIPADHQKTQAGSPLRKKLQAKSVMTQCTPALLTAAYSTKLRTRPETARSQHSGGAHRSVHYRSSERNPESFQNASLSSWFSSSGSSMSRGRAMLISRTNAGNDALDNEVKAEKAPQKSLAVTTMYPTAAEETVALERSDGYAPPKPGVKFATSMTIKESAERARKEEDPLELSITQEFDKENTVKTVVHSNRDFEIKQKPVLHTHDGLTVTGVEHVSRPECLKPVANRSLDADSGRGSFAGSEHESTSFCRTANPTTASSRRVEKVSYQQLLDGAVVSTQTEKPATSGRVYERSFHEYAQSDPRARSPNPPSRPISASRDPRFNTTAWEIYNRGHAKTNPSGMVPYYLFKRSRENAAKNRVSNEKPIFVHVSEITMHR